ncbi:OLC1v1019909C1 [Oldenlandia corymbosa var. corymbosa]|uniref:OLC1v1019909C1 n=1 Tax=Oldenlandia corymbosa var. corymbosa TaxID=529605 RepID=A0AAV1EF25_OLDCO|nr:OLC1v1019909C1 [Oldenlandia corymbosa var. corymbosa]
MGVTTLYDEYTSPVATSRLFKASVVDSHNLIPKLIPQGIKSIDITQGNGGTGSIKQINFVGGRDFSFLKYHVDELNEETFTYNYSLVEGGALNENLEKITYEVKFESTSDGGTVSKVTSKYYTKGDFALKEDDIKAGKGKVLEIYKVVENYLIQNPDAYA